MLVNVRIITISAVRQSGEIPRKASLYFERDEELMNLLGLEK
jgi:hypothetical protein